MLGFSPLSGAPLAGTGGLYTLTLSASNSVFASNVKTVNMVRASTLAMVANTLRILPQGVIATATSLATAATSIRYAILLQAAQSIFTTASKLANKTLSAVSPTLATAVKLIHMIRSVSSTLSPVAVKTVFNTLIATPLSAVGTSIKNKIMVLQSGAVVSASLSRLFSKMLPGVGVTTATQTFLIITSTLTRKAAALFISRTAAKQAESRTSKG